MADTVKTKAQLIAVDMATRPNNQSFSTENLRNLVISTFGCYMNLAETTLSDPEVVIGNLAAWTELRTTPSGGSPYTTSSTGDTLTSSTTTGRITFPASALGAYRLGYQFVVQNGALAPLTLPEKLGLTIRKNGATELGALGVAQLRAKPSVFLPAPTLPLSATTTGLFVGGLPEGFVATGLTLMAGAATGGTDYWDAIQVTNLGPSGSGTTGLFATAKTTTTGTTLTANVARTFAFDNATPANLVIAAGDILKIVLTKNNSAPNLQIIAVRGRSLVNYGSEEDVYQIHGETEAAIGTAGDYVSVGGLVLASTAGTMKIKAASFWADRIG